jgi:twitching motility two-component system response regulator PilH
MCGAHAGIKETTSMANILVVDDSITISKYIEMVLTAEGHNLTFAVDGVDAESKLKQDRFDLIITDVVMPRKNGFQLCRELKNNIQYKDIPIIMLTTKSLDVDKFWGLRQGANEYLLKPCKSDALIGAVNKYVNSKPREAEVVPAPTTNSLLRKFTSRFGH